MTYIIATLDACVLIPSAVRDLLLRCDEADLYRCRWSEEILAEVERNLGKLGVVSSNAERLLHQMQDAFESAMVDASYKGLTPLMTNHPKDRHVLAAAVASKSEYIVTENLADFPPECVQIHDIRVVTADQFLCMLAERTPAKILAVAQARAQQQSRPPETLDEMLSRLERSLPKLVQRIRNARES
jgi:predicted nucleic acid-binding protein